MNNINPIQSTYIIAKYQYMYVNYKPHTKNQKK